MTFCYQNKCDDICYTPCNPCNYRTACSYQTYDCERPCGYRSLCGYRDCSPAYSSRYCYPYSSCYSRNCTYRSCYPCYRW